MNSSESNLREQLDEWLIVMDLEGINLPWYKFVWLWISTIFKVLLVRRFSKEVIESRMRTCEECFIYDPIYKRCRNKELGCGCYVPFKVKTKGPCWGRETNEDIGWE